MKTQHISHGQSHTPALNASGNSDYELNAMEFEHLKAWDLRKSPWISVARGGLIFAGFLALTLPLMPVQAVLKRTSPRMARLFPHWYHKRVCQLLGLRLHVRESGQVTSDTPILYVSNHSTWLDIPVLSALAPVSFVAKREVGTWPGVAWLAKLQRTVFVDRERRQKTGETAGEISKRLRDGDSIVLFAEGTSTDGNRVLPFRSSLFAAAMPVTRLNKAATPSVGNAVSDGEPAPMVRTISLVYTHLHGISLGRTDRPFVAWFGDMEMVGHGWNLLKAGPIDVAIEVGPPIPLDGSHDRKLLARETEASVRRTVTRLLRDGGHDSA